MKITDPVLQDKILQALGDPDSPKILHGIRLVPKNAQTISMETGVPLSSIYRKLSLLRSAGLTIVKSFEITAEGKRQDLFLSAVSEVRIGVSGEQIHLELIPTEESASRIWFKLFNPGTVAQGAS